MRFSLWVCVLQLTDDVVRRIKVFLFVLVRDLEFSIDPTLEIEKKVKCVLLSSVFFSTAC